MIGKHIRIYSKAMVKDKNIYHLLVTHYQIVIIMIIIINLSEAVKAILKDNKINHTHYQLVIIMIIIIHIMLESMRW